MHDFILPRQLMTMVWLSFLIIKLQIWIIIKSKGFIDSTIKWFSTLYQQYSFQPDYMVLSELLFRKIIIFILSEICHVKINTLIILLFSHMLTDFDWHVYPNFFFTGFIFFIYLKVFFWLKKIQCTGNNIKMTCIYFKRWLIKISLIFKNMQFWFDQ